MQQQAVYTNERFVFLLAGAGTGKTRVIIERMKYLLQQGIPESRLLAITFTNKAANEMKERLQHDNVAIHTFHQFCYRMLKQYQTYTYDILNQDLPINEAEQLLIARYKNSFYQTKKPKVYDQYESYLKDHHLKDFDDLLLDFYHQADQWTKVISYDYIFVDEFQDTNRLQYLILKKLIQKHTSLFCVGDPDQSIYQFRGAHEKVIEQYVKDFNAKVLTLNINYRSVDSILKLANALIKRNNKTFKKVLIGVNHQKVLQYMIENDHQQQESQVLIKHIKNHIKEGVKPSEIAILYRNHQRSYDIRYAINQTYIKGIHILSLHQAKGLEFDVVFIIGLEEGSIPSYHAHTLSDLQEERRLFFVGITRAKSVLYLSYVKYNNDAEHVAKSRFLKELKKEQHLLKKTV